MELTLNDMLLEKMNPKLWKEPKLPPKEVLKEMYEEVKEMLYVALVEK